MFLQLPVAYAQSSSVNATTFGNAVDPILTNIVDPIIELMFAVAIVVFAYGVLKLLQGSFTHHWSLKPQPYDIGTTAIVGGVQSPTAAGNATDDCRIRSLLPAQSGTIHLPFL